MSDKAQRILKFIGKRLIEYIIVIIILFIFSSIWMHINNNHPFAVPAHCVGGERPEPVEDRPIQEYLFGVRCVVF